MKIEIRPQVGFQMNFLKTSADIAIGGGGAGVGKTYAEIMEPLRHISNPLFSCVFFRRTYAQIFSPGGLWDEAEKIYPLLGAKAVDNTFHFPSGAKIVFSHLQHEKNRFDWQGAQVPLIIFDELTHFTKLQFFYLLSRNRSTSGVAPYIRATCNPDADSFVRDLIEWWLDDAGFVIPERCGVIRYMTVYNDQIVWGDTKEAVRKKALHITNDAQIKSFTFIEGDIYENKYLLEKNPEYLGNLLALSEEDQLRLLKRNWNVKVDKTTIINPIKFKDIFSNEFVKPNVRRITADIATTGNDLMIIWVWEGRRALDLEMIQSNNGKEAVEAIKRLQKTYNVAASNVCFDADGVGGGITGYIQGAIEFHGAGKVYGLARYTNRRAQIYFNFADSINQMFPKTAADAYYIPPTIAERIYPFKTPSVYRGRTLEWVITHQVKALRQNKPDADGKKGLIRKEDMKLILGGISPDFLDGMAMLEMFYILDAANSRAVPSKQKLGLF